MHNLGIKVPIGEMVAKVKEVDADAIGMSGLLVKSTLIMRENLEELNDARAQRDPGAARRRGAHPPLRRERPARGLQGPAVLRPGRLRGPAHARHADDDEAQRRVGPRLRPRADRPRAARAHRRRRRGRRRRAPRARRGRRRQRGVPPPFIGSRVVKGIALDEIAAYVNETALFRNQWQYRPERAVDGESESDDEFKARIRATFREQLAAAKASGVLVPQVVYGYFPANGDGDDLVVWTDETRTTEAARFHYPRQRSSRSCASPTSSGRSSPARPTTPRSTSSRWARRSARRRRGCSPPTEYQQYLLLHGLGVEMAEALAEYWHKRIREEWGFADEDGPTLGGLFRQQYRGGRYSWGYPACPDLEDNATVAALLGAERLGIDVGEETGWQYQPEQTTSAIICHHPQAKYFVAR